MVLTKSQQKYVDYIIAFENKFGYTPTIKEISAGLLVFHNSAWEMIKRLEQKGVLKTTPGQNRTIQVLK